MNFEIVKSVLMATRPKFLLLSFAVILMPVSVAYYEQGGLKLLDVIFLFFGAIFAHIAVNLLNEYEDFKSGLDLTTVKTPFSGGSGALVESPNAAQSVLLGFVTSVVLLMAVGLYFVWTIGVSVMVFGVIGLLLIVTYTRFITRMPWLCLFAPGIAFGPLFVVGGYFVLTQSISWLIVVLSMVPFFLANNLLLLNQIPDLEADKKAGRYNVLMQIGTIDSLQVFAAFVWLAFICLGIAVWNFNLPDWVSLGFIPLLIAFPMLRDVQEYYENIDKLLPALTMNVIINLLTPVLISVGFLLAMWQV